MSQIQQAVKALVEKHGGLRAAARAVNISAAYLSRLGNSEKENPSAPVLRKLGLEKHVTYRSRK
jgi:hypothetical protein